MNVSLKWCATQFAAFAMATSVGVVAEAQLLRDDFDGTGNVDTTVWRLPFDTEGTFVGQTQFRGDASVDMPQQGIAATTGTDDLVTEIHLDSYSVIDPGNAFLGTDLLTKRDFARGGGLTFEGRLRLKPTIDIGPAGAPTSSAPIEGGAINGFFSFDVSRESSPGVEVRDEIDFELLSNQVVGGTQQVLTNVFDEDGFVGPESAGNGAFVTVGGVNLTEFNNYKVEWTPQAVKWYVNDNLVRVETEDVPDDPQKLHFNLWAPDSGFASAFDAALTPTADTAQNKRFTAQLDYVEVNRINTDVSANLLTDGSMEGSPPANNVGLGTNTGTWVSFNNGSFVFGGLDGAPAAADGAFLGKTFGPFKGFSDASGFQQQIAATEGQEFELSASAISPSTDSILGTENFTEVQLGFFDAAGNDLGEGSTFPLLDGRDANMPEDVYVEGVASAVAPAGTAFARVTLLFVQVIDGTPGPNGLGGAVYFDDVSLVELTALDPVFVEGDFNFDGVVDAEDYTVWRDNLGAADESALNGGGDGLNGIDIGDYLVWKAAFGNGASAATSVTPEPSAAVLVLTALAFAGRRQRKS